MKPKLISTPDIFIAGKKATLSFLTNGSGTSQLARDVMPRLKEIHNRVGNESYSIQVYGDFKIQKMTPETPFEKWIGVAVTNLDALPNNMDGLLIPGGKFLVFTFKGDVSGFITFWQELHRVWLPNSEYELDDRPHFEKLPASYNPASSENEEEIWVPIK
ncbi:GyrI-like domain-containing protein [Bizionia sp. KMM 8389]